MSNPFSIISGGFGSGLNFIFKLCEYTYALRAVDQHTEEYLKTAQHAWENIQTCSRLLDARRNTLPAAERRDFERVLNEAKTAAQEVARLLEPARVDVEADGKIHFGTRVLWVLRDDPAIAAALRRLDIVHTTLTQQICTLRLMDSGVVHELRKVVSRASFAGTENPPSYDRSELLHWKRQTRVWSDPGPHDFTLSDKPSAVIIKVTPEESFEPEPNFLIPEIQQHQPMFNESKWLQSTETLILPSPAANSASLRQTPAVATPPHETRRPRTWLEFQAMRSLRPRPGSGFRV